MSTHPSTCEVMCACEKREHNAELIVVTGGPGAGKTAIVEMAKKYFCPHVVILPEAATMVFSGGFWRLSTITGRQAAQRAIFHIQREMEQLVIEEKRWGLAICDRGTLDGLAYWPGSENDYWAQVGSSAQKELSRYKTVIHLRTPTLAMGYNNHPNVLRIESAEEAGLIDEKIHQIWSRHPNYTQIDSASDFQNKAAVALKLIADDVPKCCMSQFHFA